jgi:Cys-tRNA(Pro)/Cys-tRNA(Cys) deacylase
MIAVSLRSPSAVLLQEIRNVRVTGDPAGGFVCGPLDVLQASGVAFSVQEHAPIIGQADAERELGLPADQMLKTMVFRAGAATVLVALPARGRVHYGNLARAVGVQRSVLRRAEPDDLARIGMMPGGASPVCGADGVITVFDVSAFEMGTVFCGSGRADRTVKIEAKTLIDLVRPIIAAVAADGPGITRG